MFGSLWGHFGHHFGRFWAPWASFGGPWAPKGLPKSKKERRKYVLNLPGRPERPKVAQRSLQASKMDPKRCQKRVKLVTESCFQRSKHIQTNMLGTVLPLSCDGHRAGVFFISVSFFKFVVALSGPLCLYRYIYIYMGLIKHMS